MQTQLTEAARRSAGGQRAEQILRACVHCGFCNATCPTYQLLGDELDGPRGRIYLIKQVLEGTPPTARTLQHLDRCLTCRNCETTCPSGVRYGQLVEIGRATVEQQVPRPWLDRLQRRAFRLVLPYRARFAPLLRVGQLARPLLPAPLREAVPERRTALGTWPTAAHPRKVVLLEGCVQPALRPNINQATAQVLDRLGIEAVRIPAAGCCGAVSLHLNAHDEAEVQMRRNIDAWWPALEAGAEAIVANASACGLQLKEYGDLLRNDPAYAAKAARISALTRDIAELVAAADLTRLRTARARRLVFHPPCTLQHGQRIKGVVEAILQQTGHTLLPFNETHLCCGSAGTYSLLQPALSNQLRSRKLGHLLRPAPELIASANIGCLEHLAAKTDVPVVHWIELLAER
ncbi:MAG: glycolate oxidase subunit GlcF [Thiotrichales bacterium]